jgi:phosphoglycolate phosphatase
MRIKRPNPIASIKARLTKKKRPSKAVKKASPFTVVYDFDGTLADTMDEMLRIFNEMAQKRGYRQVTAKNLEQLRHMSVRQVAHELGVPMVLLPVLLLQGKRRLSKVMGKVKPFAGILPMLAKLQKKGCMQGIATSNSRKNTNLFIEGSKISSVQFLETGIGVLGKERRFKRMMKKYKLTPERLIYVGDELRDIEAARAAGIRVISVTWGMNDGTALRAAKPDYIAETPDDVVKIVSAIMRKKEE